MRKIIVLLLIIGHLMGASATVAGEIEDNFSQGEEDYSLRVTGIRMEGE